MDRKVLENVMGFFDNYLEKTKKMQVYTTHYINIATFDYDELHHIKDQIIEGLELEYDESENVFRLVQPIHTKRNLTETEVIERFNKALWFKQIKEIMENAGYYKKGYRKTTNATIHSIVIKKDYDELELWLKANYLIDK